MDKALKQRLVGASVLVALAVIVLPMLLGGQPEEGGEARQIEIPPKPRETAFETRRFPIGEQPADTPSVVPDTEAPEPVNLPPPRPESGPASATQASTPAASPPDDVAGSDLLSAPDAGEATAAGEPEAPAEGVEEEASDGVATATESSPMDRPAATTEPEQLAPVEAAPVTAPAQATAAAGGRYLVQVASFSAPGNATRLATRLREQGLPVLEDTVDSEAGTLHRVRLGPFEQRSQADRAITSLRQQYSDLSPRVLDLRPTEEAPVTSPSDPLVRWVVQLGSFGDPANAEQLVFRLRDEGYSAFSVAVSGASGTAHKVRVGPVTSRDEAVRLETRIESSMGLDGLVMSTD